MKTEFAFTVQSLLTRKDGTITGPMSPFEFAKDVARQTGNKFNRLARVWFNDDEILQRIEDDGLTAHDHLIIAGQYANDLWLSLWIDDGTGGMLVAICFMSDRQLVVTSLYRSASFARKLTDEEITALFDHIFSHPHELDILNDTAL